MQSYSSSEVFLKIRSVRILDSIGSNRWFGCSLRLGMPLNSPARRPSSSVSCSLTSDNGRAPGRMLDTLLPIPDAEYPAFYPIGIKASCVCVLRSWVRRSRVGLARRTLSAKHILVCAHTPGVDKDIRNLRLRCLDR